VNGAATFAHHHAGIMAKAAQAVAAQGACFTENHGTKWVIYSLVVFYSKRTTKSLLPSLACIS